MPAGTELPANVAGWTADPARAVLLFHDMQRYFLAPFPRGESPRRELDVNTALLRHRCAALGMPVAYTAQPGGMTDRQRGLLRDFWGPGMRTDPADRRIAEPIRPAAHDWVFTKWRYSAFFRSDLLARIRGGGRDQLLLCGVYAHLGVLMTAVEAFSNDIETFLVADAVADFSAGHHRLAMEYAAQRCAVVTTTRALLGQLAAAAARGPGAQRSEAS
jgi:isochorismate hydrolase